jgi:MoaA/NifB/PqqE/SkfB family radical SAM enzyme
MLCSAIPSVVRITTARLADLDRERVQQVVWAALGGTPEIHLRIDPRENCGMMQEVVDLLHIPLGDTFDLTVAEELGKQGCAGPIGVLLGQEEVLLMDGEREVFRHFLQRQVRRHDIGLYEEGGSIREQWQQERGQVPLPNQVYLGLTQACNRSCNFCVSRQFEPTRLDLETIERLAWELRDRVRLVALTGAGEAMVHPQFWAVVELFTKIIPGVEFKMNTSGVTLARNASKLVEWPFRNITVSLNAAKEATYEQFVGKGFGSVLDGIRALVTWREKANRKDLRLTLSIVLMKSTLPELPQFVDLAFRLGVEEIQGIHLMIHDDQLAAESPWLDREESNYWLNRTTLRAAALGVIANLPPLFGCGRKRDAVQFASLPTSVGQACVEAWSIAYVRPDGNLIACPYGEQFLGNIKTASFDSVWNGNLYNDLRHKLVDRDYWGMCQHCCGLNEAGHVDDFESHWLGERGGQSRGTKSNVRV